MRVRVWVTAGVCLASIAVSSAACEPPPPRWADAAVTTCGLERGRQFDMGGGPGPDRNACERECAAGVDGSCVTLGLLDARAPLDRRDLAGARRRFAAVCERAYAPACVELGRALLKGEGGPADERRAASLAESACAQRYQPGCSLLAVVLTTGRDEHKDVPRAKRLFEESCEAGDLRACSGVLKSEPSPARSSAQARLSAACDRHVQAACAWLGSSLGIGEGGVKDVERGAGLLERACAGGFAPGCYQLAKLQLDGAAGGRSAAMESLKKGCAAGEPAACVDLGNGYSDAKNEAEALRLYELACSAGDTRGCVALGQAYELNQRVPGAAAKALAAYERACDLGRPTGCVWAGAMFEKEDPARARAFFERACSNGAGLGCSKLGAFFREGKIVGRDLARATALFQQGCDGGSGGGCRMLGIMAQKGEAGPPDPPRAAAFFERGCAANDALSCAELGNMFSELRVPGRSAIDAVGAYERGCAQKYDYACLRLSSLLADDGSPRRDVKRAVSILEPLCMTPEKPPMLAACSLLRVLLMKGRDVPRDPARVLALSERLCQHHGGSNCAVLASEFEFGGEATPVDEDRALPLYRRAEEEEPRETAQILDVRRRNVDTKCLAGKGRDCANLGWSKLHGLGVAEDPKEAARLFDKACALGDAMGCRLLGRAHVSGTGVRRDVTQGVRFLDRACKGGDAPACAERAVLGSRSAAAVAADLDRACGQGNAHACVELGKHQMRTASKPTSEKSREARQIFDKACRANVAAGCYELGKLLSAEAAEPRGNVLDAFRRGCNFGSGRSCLAAVEMLETTEKDEALRLARHGCWADEARSCLKVAAASAARGDAATSQRARERACILGEKSGCESK